MNEAEFRLKKNQGEVNIMREYKEAFIWEIKPKSVPYQGTLSLNHIILSVLRVISQ